MWVILKIDNKKINLLKNDFEKKTGKNFVFYKPKLKISKYLNNKLIDKEVDLLGDYVFCFSQSFSEKNTINLLRFSVGLKYFLNGFFCFQREIETFINRCKNLENREGFISPGLSQCKKNQIYQFLSGPFVKNFFKIINLKDNKIKILLGGVETYINKNKYFFHLA